MDYEINLTSLSSKVTELEGMKTDVQNIKSEYDGGYINQITSTEISSLANKAAQSIERLKKGYDNTHDWFNRYVTEFTSLEDNLTSFKSDSLTSPKEFTGEFMDIFSKVTIPALQTKNEQSTTSDLDPDSLEAKKAAFAGDVNDASQFYIDPSYSKKLAHMTCFDNSTGEILKDGDTITLKPGETKILTVKLPDYCGEIDYVYRTTAQEDKSGVISNRSDIDPDPNKVDYVRWEPGNPNRQFHLPSSNVSLKFNTYDWIITANRDGTFLASQTCEFKSHGTDSSGKVYKYSGKKAMVALNVVVKSD